MAPGVASAEALIFIPPMTTVSTLRGSLPVDVDREGAGSAPPDTVRPSEPGAETIVGVPTKVTLPVPGRANGVIVTVIEPVVASAATEFSVNVKVAVVLDVPPCAIVPTPATRDRGAG